MHDLVVAAGRNPAGGRGFRAVLETHHHLDLGAERLLVEFDRLLAAAVEEQIRCRHGLSPLSTSLGMSKAFRNVARWQTHLVQAACDRLRAAISNSRTSK